MKRVPKKFQLLIILGKNAYSEHMLKVSNALLSGIIIYQTSEIILLPSKLEIL